MAKVSKLSKDQFVRINEPLSGIIADLEGVTERSGLEPLQEKITNLSIEISNVFAEVAKANEGTLLSRVAKARNESFLGIFKDPVIGDSFCRIISTKLGDPVMSVRKTVGMLCRGAGNFDKEYQKALEKLGNVKRELSRIS
jgi:hypothetical protein